MTPRVLFIITSDPRTSGKPAEAIRIAAGVSAWKRTEVSVYLRGAAVLALADDTADLINEENYRHYLPMLIEMIDNKRPIYVEKDCAALADVGESPVRFEQLTDAQLAKLSASQTYVLRF
jgi:sulfur relay (sulfurtransferase) DsrF/TusC family protein